MIWMPKLLVVVFWVSLGTVLYTYFLYPLLLWLLGRGHRRPFLRRRVKASDLPTVTMVFSAYNEEAVIEQKLANCRQLNYPPEKLRFLIGSDGSTDRTGEILSRLDSPRFSVHLFEKRRGKVQVLNDLMRRVDSEIVVFSDANTLYQRNAIDKLVWAFQDQRVGCVIGKLNLIAATDDTQVCRTEGLYWRYENVIKRLESQLGIVPSINGGIFAIRRVLFEPLPPHAITEDQVLGMRIMALGYRCEFAERARAWESVSDWSGELRRRIRISAGNFQSLFFVPRIMCCGPVSFAFISHKLLRWLVPFCLLAILLSNLFLSGTPFYGFAMLAQVFFYGCGILGTLLPAVGQGLKVLMIPKYFLAMNLAILIGFTRFVTGRQRVTWNKGR